MDVLDLRFGGAHGDRQPIGYLDTREPECHQLRNLPLPAAQD